MWGRVLEHSVVQRTTPSCLLIITDVMLCRVLFVIALLGASCASFQFNDDGKFKIVQFTDMHFGESFLDDDGTIVVQKKVLEAERPDLVVLSGDAVSGYDDTGEEGWFAKEFDKATKAMRELDIPWAYIFGNHDDQGKSTRDQILSIDMSYNLSASKRNMFGKHGNNYNLEISGANRQGEGASTSDDGVAAVVWMMDSMDTGCVGVEPGWGCVYPEAVQWYRDTALALQQKQGGVVPSIMFFHIPIIEYLSAWNFYTSRGMKEDNVCCSSVNSGLFAAVREVGDVMATFCGHDHNNDFFAEYHNVTLYYGRKTGYGSYGPPMGVKRGGRVIEITEKPFVVKTWIREENGDIVTESDQPQHAPKPTDQEAYCGDSLGGSSSLKYKFHR